MSRIYASLLDRIDLWACDKPVGLILFILIFIVFIAIGIITHPTSVGFEQVGNLRIHTY